MENVIFWFSGSGNSLLAAKKIADAIGDCRLIRITEKTVGEKISVEADRLGLVFPVHAWGPPDMVERFILSLKTVNARYAFSLAVNAGSVENTQGIVNKLMKAKGREMNAFFDLRTPGNLGMRRRFDAESAAAELRKAETKLFDIIADIKARDTYPMPPVTVARRILKSGFAHAMVRKMARGFDKNFSVTDSCNRCGECVRLCPSGNIEITGLGKVIWKHCCNACMACISRCPRKAIRFRNADPENCYRNPLVKNSDYE
jgi:NAD-dependent dihydropyrimidine dehydrogenase PreA subunit